MGRVLLVRHGQASFGSEDYDRLSALGAQQCVRLGEHWRERGMLFTTVMRGSLRRHVQSLDAVTQGLGVTALPIEHRGLNEYNGEALIGALGLPALERVDTVDAAREHFRRLRTALRGWMRGELAPQGMPAFRDFRAGVQQALATAHAHSREGDVLIVSSGGPIAVALGHVLQAPEDTTIALNMRLRNSAVTELATTAQGFDLVAYNALPHLEGDAAMQTHA